MTSAVLNTWSASNSKAAETVSRTAALVKAAANDPSLSTEAKAKANEALTAAVACLQALQEFKALAGII